MTEREEMLLIQSASITKTEAVLGAILNTLNRIETILNRLTILEQPSPPHPSQTVSLEEHLEGNTNGRVDSSRNNHQARRGAKRT